MSKSKDKKCLAPLGNSVDGRHLGLERPDYREWGKDESGIQNTWIQILVAKRIPGLVVFGCHLHGWVAEFLSFLRPPALTSLGETEEKCSPLKHWNKTTWLSLVTNHHILLCTSWVFDNMSHMTGKEKKNASVIIIKMKTMEIIRSIWIQNTNECKSWYLHRNVATLQISVKIQK